MIDATVGAAVRSSRSQAASFVLEATLARLFDAPRRRGTLPEIEPARGPNDANSPVFE